MKDLQNVKLMDLHTPSIAEDANVKAMSESLDALFQETIGFIGNVAIIKNLVARNITDSALVDQLAWQYDAAWYDPELPLETRLELAANWIEFHLLRGTPHAVERVVEIVYDDAVIKEWFQYGGEPYTFKIQTEIPDATEATINRLIDIIFSVKNTRSWLEGIEVLWRANMNLYAGMALAQHIYHHIDMRLPYWEVETQPTVAYCGVHMKLRPVAFAFLEV